MVRRRVLIIGASGFLGGEVLAACRSLPGCEVYGASRSPREGAFTVVDLKDPGTFQQLDYFDVVVDCSDALSVRPDECLRYCLERGIAFVETTARTDVIERVLVSERGKAAARYSAIAVLGAGMFPGLTNLAASAVLKPSSHELVVGMRFDPLSGAGAGIARLMTEVLLSDAVYYRAGRRVRSRGMTPGPALPFPSGRFGTARVGMPEAVMLQWSTGVGDTSTYVSLRGPLGAPAAFSPTLALSGLLPRTRCVKRAIGRSFELVRSGACANRRAPCEFAVVSHRRGGRDTVAAFFADGILATALSIAVCVEAVSCCGGLAPGIYLPDELFAFDDFVDRMRTSFDFCPEIVVSRASSGVA